MSHTCSASDEPRIERCITVGACRACGLKLYMEYPAYDNIPYHVVDQENFFGQPWYHCLGSKTGKFNHEPMDPLEFMARKRQNDAGD